MRLRLSAHERTIMIESVAVRFAAKHGLMKIDRRQVAKLAGCSEPLISHYYPTIENLRDAVMVRAGELGATEDIINATFPGGRK